MIRRGMQGMAGYARLTTPQGRSRNPTGLDKGRTATEERRKAYAEAREAGASEWDAATAVGVDPYSTGRAYERCYKSGLAGGAG